MRIRIKKAKQAGPEKNNLRRKKPEAVLEYKPPAPDEIIEQHTREILKAQGRAIDKLMIGEPGDGLYNEGGKPKWRPVK